MHLVAVHISMPEPSTCVYRLCLKKQSNIPFPFLWCFKLHNVGIFPLPKKKKNYILMLDLSKQSNVDFKENIVVTQCVRTLSLMWYHE